MRVGLGICCQEPPPLSRWETIQAAARSELLQALGRTRSPGNSRPAVRSGPPGFAGLWTEDLLQIGAKGAQGCVRLVGRRHARNPPVPPPGGVPTKPGGTPHDCPDAYCAPTAPTSPLPNTSEPPATIVSTHQTPSIPAPTPFVSPQVGAVTRHISAEGEEDTLASLSGRPGSRTSRKTAILVPVRIGITIVSSAISAKAAWLRVPTWSSSTMGPQAKGRRAAMR